MAEREGNETIRSMLAGFNSMQASVGLLPVQSGQMPLGVSLNAPPPPPAIPHPSEYAIAAIQQQQQAMQQTVQAAQMTRYAPPPSAPFTWGRSMDQLAGQQLNPYVAGALGGGGGGMPNPMFMTSPQFGMYRPPAPGMSMFSSMQRIPSQFNPFAPAIGAPHFSTPALQQLQVMNAYQAQGAGMIAGAMEGGLGMAGSIGGAALGTALLGPLGGLVGGWAGGKIGGALSGMMVGPGMADAVRGRQIQNMSAPWMVSGPNLNPFTGQGMERQAARETAFGLRHLQRDYDFGRTGFNTQDVMRLTQLASDQGLLQTAQHPEEIVRKMRDVAKSVKALVQITGDPDVRNAIASLGEMRRLGFEGLGGQAGAVANRAAFARMAGVSQAAMHEQFGMPGAMMAQGLGLAGSTGYMAGMVGAGTANVAVSGGAFSDLQLARAGGRQGVAQTNMMAQLGAANQDIYMAAALRRNAAGELDVDMGAYRRAQRMSTSEVAGEAARRMNEIGPQGIFELSTRRQEFKDRLQRGMSPMEQQLNVLRQAAGLQRDVGGGMTMGAALRTMIGSTPGGQGMGEEEREQMARTLELQYESGGFWNGLEQQLRVQKRDAQDRRRALREQYRTPGALSRLGRGIRNNLGGASDLLSSPFTALMERADRVEEDRMAYDRGEQVRRFSESQLVRTRGDEALTLGAMRSGDFGRLTGATGADPLAATGLVDNARSMNRLGNFLGLTSYSAANRAVDIANRSRGTLFDFHTTYGDVGAARQRIEGLQGTARMVQTGMGRSSQQAAAGILAAQATAGKGNVAAVLTDAAQMLKSRLPVAGLLTSASAVDADMIKKSFIDAARKSGMDEETANAVWARHGDLLGGEMARSIYQSGDQKAIETLEKAIDASGRAGSLDPRRARENVQAQFERNFEDLGLNYNAKSATFESIKNMVKNTDPRVLALAAARAAGNTAEIKKIQASLGGDAAGLAKFAEMSDQAAGLFKGQGGAVQGALRRMGMQKNLTQSLRELRQTVGVDMGLQSLQTAAQRIGEQAGVSLGDVGSVDQILGGLAGASDESISNVRGAAGAAIRAYRKAAAAGDKGAMAAARAQLEGAIPGLGAKGRVEGFGGEGIGDIDQQIAEVQSLRDKYAKDKKADPTQELFASSVELFAQAAKDLKATTENIALANASPLFQGAR